MAPKRLRLAPDLDLPLDFATEGVVVIGVRGSGKSNTEVRYAELLHGAGIPFVAIDPKGDWYGIRMDAEAPGLPIPVFGGLYGDFPLEAHLGATIADLIVDNNISAVIDVSRMTHAARARFLTDFFKRLMERHQLEPHVRTVIFEEAHRYIPQQVKGDAAALKEAAASVLLEGRSFGLGCWACTQRPARLHNDVLEEVDSAIIHRIGVTATADLKRVRDWVKHEELGDEIGSSLTKLRAGEAWILSPVSLGIVQRVQVDRRTTFDSGATPVVGSEGVMKRRLSTMADIDVPAIKEALAETIEKARADDPGELRRLAAQRAERIAELERQVQALASQPVEPPPPVEIEISVLTEEQVAAIEGLTAALNRAFDASTEQVNALLDLLDRAPRPSAGAKEDQGSGRGSSAPQVRRASTPTSDAPPARAQSVPPQPEGKTPAGAAEMRPPSQPAPSDARLSTPQQTILNVLAEYETIHVEMPTRTQVAFRAGVSPRSSGFENNLGRLRSLRLIDYPRSGCVHLTAEGRGAASWPSVPMTATELQEAVLGMVSKPQAAILRHLLSLPPGTAQTRQEIAEAVGVSAVSSGYENNLGALRGLGLVDYPARGEVALTDQMFLAGAA